MPTQQAVESRHMDSQIAELQQLIAEPHIRPAYKGMLQLAPTTVVQELLAFLDLI